MKFLLEITTKPYLKITLTKGDTGLQFECFSLSKLTEYLSFNIDAIANVNKEGVFAEDRHYELNTALEEVPKKYFAKAKLDVMNLLGITSRQQLLAYQNGTVNPPDIDKALKVENYFYTTYGITDVWKEVKTSNQ